jgi:hypothetical protein
MIVNVNPFDTGFDENAHVMRFAAIAREVTVASLRPPSPTKLPMRRVVSPSQGSAARPEARRRSVTLQFGGARPSQTLEVLEGTCAALSRIDHTANVTLLRGRRSSF